MAILRNSFFRFPSTKLGRWAVGLAAIFGVMYVIHIKIIESVYQIVEDRVANHTILPTETIWTLWQIYYYSMFWVFGFGACILAPIAVIFKHERSWLVWLIIIIEVWIILNALLWFSFLAFVHG